MQQRPLRILKSLLVSHFEKNEHSNRLRHVLFCLQAFGTTAVVGIFFSLQTNVMNFRNFKYVVLIGSHIAMTQKLRIILNNFMKKMHNIQIIFLIDSMVLQKELIMHNTNF